jgi:hypothetical protein
MNAEDKESDALKAMVVRILEVISLVKGTTLRECPPTMDRSDRRNYLLVRLGGVDELHMLITKVKRLEPLDGVDAWRAILKLLRENMDDIQAELHCDTLGEGFDEVSVQNLKSQLAGAHWVLGLVEVSAKWKLAEAEEKSASENIETKKNGHNGH